ncbi:MAG: CHAD domain-containing protein [Pseudomonadaceae bacterium]|nr:MAG: CHAD domain-containing protein [Pseudomonadaceae bacterium]
MAGKSRKRLIKRAEALHKASALLLARETPLSPSHVHQLRVSIKELRALWQMLQPFLAPGEAARASRDIGRAAKRLATARDQHVQLKTLDKRIRKAQDAELQSLRRARDQLSARQADAPEQPLLIEDIAVRFAQDRQRWQDLELTCGRRELMRKGYGRLYRKARKCFRRASKGGSAEDWHRLRRWVKYLALALPVIADDSVTKATSRRYARLAEKLGELNDLDVLATRLKQLSGKNGKSACQAIAQVEQRAERVQKKCHKQARRLFQ